MCRNTDGCVCCWLMNVVVYNLKSLISVIKASVCKKSYTSRKTAHACMHPLVLIIFHTASYMFTSNSYSVRGNTKFVSPMYKHTPMPLLCFGTIYIYVSSCKASRILQNSGTFFYVVYTQHLESKPGQHS